MVKRSLLPVDRFARLLELLLNVFGLPKEGSDGFAAMEEYLSPREKEILRLRFGEEKRSGEEVAKLLGLTNQSIQRNERKALRILAIEEFICKCKPNVLKEVKDLLLRQEIDKLLATLTRRERKVIRMRFGLEDGREHTLEEVAKSFRFCREYIRVIEAKALRKLCRRSRPATQRESVRKEEKK